MRNIESRNSDIINNIIHVEDERFGDEENDEDVLQALTCPSCGYNIQLLRQGDIQELPGLPAGVKFDPSDEEIIGHLEEKVLIEKRKLHHPLIDQFIPTIQALNGICYAHPQNLPGVSKEGQIRHFFHRPSKAYTTGTRKRRKVTTEEEGVGETRWHKTGKTRPIFTVNKTLKGYKKILVLYSNYGTRQKPEKTNWIMHQYHLGVSEDERDGEMVVSKVFYQTHSRQHNSAAIKEPGHKKKSRPSSSHVDDNGNHHGIKEIDDTEQVMKPWVQGNGQNRESLPPMLIPVLVSDGEDSSYFNLPSLASKNK